MHSSVNAAGGTASGSGGSATYSVGQLVYTKVSGSSGSSSQGVQQPFEINTNGIEDNNISLNMLAFPNPVSSALNLRIENQNFDNLMYSVFDMNGSLQASQTIKNTNTSIAMDKLATGTYILKVSNNKSIVKSFTIIKK